MKVIIPAAGKGTRMRPFTHSKPKPLLPVAGKPMIKHIMDSILPLQPTEVWFITGHLKDALEEEVREEYEDKVKLYFVEQVEPRGTAQAISLAKGAFDEDILIVFSDTIFEADLTVIKECEDDGIFWAMKVEDPRRFGVMVTNEQGYLDRIVEKPDEFVSDLANIGLYYIKNTPLLKEGLDIALEKLEGTKREIYHVEAFQHMLEKGAKIKILQAQGWYDCGTQEETLNTNRKLLEKHHGNTVHKEGVTIREPVAIHETAELQECTIGPFVSIGPHAEIKGSTVHNSIIDRHSKIQNSKITNSIIGQHVEIYGKSGTFFLGDHSTLN